MFHRITSTKDQLAAEVRELQTKLQQARDEVRDLEQQHSDDQVKISNLSNLCASEQNLRQTLLKDLFTQEPADWEIYKVFTDLRCQLQTIAHSKTLQVRNTNLPLTSDLSPRFQHLGSIWNRYPKHDRLHILRAALYLVLNDFLLNKELFGIKDSENTSTSGYQLEEGFGAWERQMRSRKVPRHVLAVWRFSTLKCIDYAECGEPGRGQLAAEAMAKLVKPFISQSASKKDLETLDKEIHDVCMKAHAVRIAMRKGKSEYRCWAVEPETRWQDTEKCAIPYGDIKNGSKGFGDTVAFTLFGALAKETEMSSETRILEKAQVIMNPPK